MRLRLRIGGMTNTRELAKLLIHASYLLGATRRQFVGIGCKCDKCGQEPQLYGCRNQTRVLSCWEFYRQLVDMRYECERALYADSIVWPPSGRELSIVGFRFDQPVQCGRDLALELRMRHCWFPEAA